MNSKKQYLSLSLILAMASGVLFFQNCGSSQTSQSASTQQQSNSDAKAYVLPSEVTPLIESYKMDWTFTASNPDFGKAINGLAGQCEKLRLDFEATRQMAPIIYEEGLMPGDPKIAQFAPVKASFDKVLNIAFCAYFSKTPVERLNALNTVIKFIVDWNNTYVGDGNPINERFFIKLFTVADLIFPYLNQEQINAVRSLAMRIDQKEVAFMATLTPSDNRLKNLWYVRHLTILTYANLILGNSARIQELKTKVNQVINDRHTTPAGFALSTCANLRSIGSYGSFDLQERDGLMPHIEGITDIVSLMVLNPSFVGVAENAKLLAAVELTKPYVLGTKTHAEFACSKVKFDIDRLALDPTLGANWNPNNARTAFRYVRLIWGSSDSWTGRFITDEYAPWFKVFYSGKGDILKATP